MSAPGAPLKVAAIELCGSSGFRHPARLRLAEHDSDDKLTGKGRNLLVYGENGSGKSSLGKALRDFLDFRSTAPKFDDFKYRHTEPPRTDRGVRLVFDDPAVGGSQTFGQLWAEVTAAAATSPTRAYRARDVDKLQTDITSFNDSLKT